MSGRYPKGLFLLFATEMWERFSFYGISAVLVLYLTTGLGLPDAQAALTSGAYMAFTFMSPILGGLIADRLLGLRYSVSLGGVLILLGNLVLAWKEALPFVFAGLALVALGTGYLKATARSWWVTTKGVSRRPPLPLRTTPSQTRTLPIARGRSLTILCP